MKSKESAIVNRQVGDNLQKLDKQSEKLDEALAQLGEIKERLLSRSDKHVRLLPPPVRASSGAG